MDKLIDLDKKRRDARMSGRSGTKEKVEGSAECQSNISGSSQTGQSERLGRKFMGKLREANIEAIRRADRQEEIRLLPTRIRSLAQKLQGIPYYKWSSQDMANAQELLGEKVVRAIISSQENKRKI